MTMKRLLLSALCAVPAFCMGQTLLYNDGAMIKVQTGATLYVEGGIHNTTTGTIDNDGTIEVKGNFINEGMWDAAQANTLKFSGNVDSQVSPGSAVFHDVVIQKDATFNVVLAQQMTAAGHMTINNSLNFNAAGASRIVTGNFDLKLGTAALAVIGADADEYVATTGTGMMQKSVTANGTYAFPIGDLTNYSPISSTYTGSAYAAANIRTKANDAVHPNKPADATEYITRYWDVNATGITGYSNTLTGTYIPADLTLGGGGTAAQVKGAIYDGANWDYAAAASGANIVIGSTNDATADFTGTNFFGKANLMAFLQGPFSAGSMSILLNTGGYIPLNSPYPDAPASVGSIPANVTDWIKLELRDAGSPGTILGASSAFIKNTGVIVGLDGTSLPLIKNGNPTSIVAVVHRNHLPFRTNVGLDVVNPTLEDFTIVNPKLYDNAADNPPLNTVSGKFVMWPSDASGATYIVNSTDLNFVKAQSATTPTGYLRADVNLNGAANSTDLNLTKSISAVPKTADL
jgi:hypothetical protein